MSVENIDCHLKNEEAEPHIVIIKYLNHQKFKVNNDWLTDIKNISKDSELNIKNLNVSSLQLSQIKKLEPLLKQSTLLQKVTNLHLYYVFILLNLPNYMIKNLARSFLAKLYYETQKKGYFTYLEILDRNKYLEDLISILNHCPKEINLFVQTINNFFT